MKNNLKVYLCTLCLLLVSIGISSTNAQAANKSAITLVKNHQAKSRILVNTNDSVDLKAALILQRFIQEATNAQLPIVEIRESKAKRNDIMLNASVVPNTISTASITEDGFYIYSDKKNKRLYIGGEELGVIYGVITLLEQELGIKYLKAGTYTITKRQNLNLPSLNIQENPSFRYRQTQAYSIEDPLYKLWHRLEEPQEVFAAGYWVHTFNRLLPSAQYGKSHPEYYAYMNGVRHPGDVSQWCLTNEDVFTVVSNRVDSIFKANPDKHMLSVSQNDSQIYCRCDKCQKILDTEGTPAGPLVYFLNKLAKRFPDKEFSTLAYLFSVPAPKHIKPLPNVNIMLCDIDAYREVPLTDNPSGQEFVKELVAWSKITNNIFVWDYGINFDNYIAPFPNFHILQPNMQLFKKYGATMHFSQIAGSKGGDFSELRSYLVSKLLWNVDVNVEDVINEFLVDFYGKEAAPYLYDYIKLREKAMLESKIPLWIYDTPVTHKDGMLTDAKTAQYNNLFDLAEQAVSYSPTYLARVREERLTILYSELEIIRTKQDADKSNLKDKVELFRARAKAYGVTSLNERVNLIEDYCDLYIERNLPKDRVNLALNAPITYIQSPDAPYDQLKGALTDGLFGGSTFNDGWVGWEGKNAEFILDLGKEKEFTVVALDFLHKLGAWVLMPKSIKVETSNDNLNYTLFDEQIIDEDKDVEVKYNTYNLKNKKAKAKYLRINIETIGLCPHWHYGVGNPAWFFLDEIEVFNE